MAKSKTDSDPHIDPLSPPRVIADFGGRRKTFDRRLKTKIICHRDRRAQDRRSGFDRRSLIIEDSAEFIPEKRDTKKKSKYDSPW